MEVDEARDVEVELAGDGSANRSRGGDARSRTRQGHRGQPNHQHDGRQHDGGDRHPTCFRTHVSPPSVVRYEPFARLEPLRSEIVRRVTSRSQECDAGLRARSTTTRSSVPGRYPRPPSRTLASLPLGNLSLESRGTASEMRDLGTRRCRGASASGSFASGVRHCLIARHFSTHLSETHVRAVTRGLQKISDHVRLRRPGRIRA